MDKQAAVAETLDLIQQGYTCNQACALVAETAGVKSPRTIANWCEQAGHNLGELAHAEAKKAHMVAREQYAARRAEVRLMLLYRVIDELARADDVWKPNEARDQATTVGIYLDKLRLEEGEATGRTEHVTVDSIVRDIQQLEQQLGIGDSGGSETLPARNTSPG